MPRVYSYPARHACDTLILSWRCSSQSDSFISHQILSTTAIFLTERQPPAGEAPVEWLLLSSQPVTTLADAVETVKWYLCRWEVEVYFRIYKSGCRGFSLKSASTWSPPWPCT